MKKCLYCGNEVNDEGTCFWDNSKNSYVYENYCNLFCRSDHDKKLVMEGKRDPILNSPVILKNKQYKDGSGETVWFPNDERPYFDQGLRRVFHTPKEKHDFMKAHNLISTGDSDWLVKKQRREHEEKTGKRAEY